MSKLNKTVWVLTDDRTGHNSQSIGVAEHLRLPYIKKIIKYSWLGCLPNCLKLIPFMTFQGTAGLKAPWPDVVIATGRRLAPIAREIKKQSGGKTILCQMMWPGGSINEFDVLAVPQHDDRAGAGVISTVGAPHNITLQKLEAAAKAGKLTHQLGPVIAVLLGGSTQKSEFTLDIAAELVDKLNQKVQSIGGRVLLTFSRRTPAGVVDAVTKNLRVPHQFYHPDDEGENPYLGFLGLADAVVVTGDSISMCTEACASHVPVFIYAPSDLVPKKHQLLHNSLYEAQCARPFYEFEAWNPEKREAMPRALNEATRIAAILKEKLKAQ
jgi:mitochondrial fission protein ELM1